MLLSKQDIRTLAYYTFLIIPAIYCVILFGATLNPLALFFGILPAIYASIIRFLPFGICFFILSTKWRHREHGERNALFISLAFMLFWHFVLFWCGEFMPILLLFGLDVFMAYTDAFTRFFMLYGIPAGSLAVIFLRRELLTNK